MFKLLIAISTITWKEKWNKLKTLRTVKWNNFKKWFKKDGAPV